MVAIKLISRDEAMQTRRAKEPGIRRRRMDEFDLYVEALKDAPDGAIAFEDIEESPQKFVLSLRGAFKRHGLTNVTVRKLRGRDEVRAWFTDETVSEPEPDDGNFSDFEPEEAEPEPEPEPEPMPRRRAGRPARQLAAV